MSIYSNTCISSNFRCLCRQPLAPSIFKDVKVLYQNKFLKLGDSNDHPTILNGNFYSVSSVKLDDMSFKLEKSQLFLPCRTVLNYSSFCGILLYPRYAFYDQDLGHQVLSCNVFTWFMVVFGNQMDDHTIDAMNGVLVRLSEVIRSFVCYALAISLLYSNIPV